MTNFINISKLFQYPMKKDINPPISTTKGCSRDKMIKSSHNVTNCLNKKNHVWSIITKKRKKEAQTQQNLNPIFDLKL
ncbi:hypothetical protein CR513_57693, partial [Mucuna pruriens]